MENSNLKITAGSFSYDRFFDGKKIEAFDRARKHCKDPIPESPCYNDLYYSKSKESFYAYNNTHWVNVSNENDKYTTFGIRLLYKKDNETKKD